MSVLRHIEKLKMGTINQVISTNTAPKMWPLRCHLLIDKAMDNHGIGSKLYYWHLKAILCVQAFLTITSSTPLA